MSDKRQTLDAMTDAIAAAKCVAAMTGAGVSTLCGIPDFRGPQGLYKNPDAERIFDIDWFDRDPSVYYRGCRELVYGLGGFRPGPVHVALKKLEDAGKLAGIMTQNIDMLHQKAGSSRVWEVHGSPLMHHCRRCGKGASFEEVMGMIAANGGISLRKGTSVMPSFSASIQVCVSATSKTFAILISTMPTNSCALNRTRLKGTLPVVGSPFPSMMGSSIWSAGQKKERQRNHSFSTSHHTKAAVSPSSDG